MRKHRFYLSITAVPAIAGIALQQPAPAPAATVRTASRLSAQAVADSIMTAVTAVPSPSASITGPPDGFGSSIVLASFRTSVAQSAAFGPAVAAGTGDVPLPATTTALPFVAPVQAPTPTPTPAPDVPPVTAPPPPHPTTSVGATPAVWASLRQCESNGNYGDNTGNGYYGAYQFSLSTWRGLGYAGLPSNASAAVQDQAAQRLQARSGWGQWPACSRRLGL